MNTFTPNWKLLGFKSADECMAHVMHFLKLHEKQILSHGITGEVVFQYGDYKLVLGSHDKKEGVAKKKKPDKNGDKD